MLAEGIAGHLNPLQFNPEFKPQARVFEKLDSNQDGTLDTEEIDDFTNKLSEKIGKELSSQEILQKMDSNQDGELTQDEFKFGNPNRAAFNKAKVRSKGRSNLNLGLNGAKEDSEIVDVNEDGIPDSEQSEAEINNMTNQYSKYTSGNLFGLNWGQLI